MMCELHAPLAKSFIESELKGFVSSRWIIFSDMLLLFRNKHIAPRLRLFSNDFSSKCHSLIASDRFEKLKAFESKTTPSKTQSLMNLINMN